MVATTGPADSPLYFVCYSREDRQLVDKIRIKLKRREQLGELRLFVDTASIEPGDSFRREIGAALAEASGAIVLVSDEFWGSEFIQTNEWPMIEARREAEGSDFALLLLAMTHLDSDDPLRQEVNFVGDVTSTPLRYAAANEVGVRLQTLSDLIGNHARSRRSRPEVDRGRRTIEPDDVVSTRASTRQQARPTGITSTLAAPERRGIFGAPSLPGRFIPTPEVDAIVDAVGRAAASGLTGLRGEGGTGKTVIARAAIERAGGGFTGGAHWVTVGEHVTSEAIPQIQAQLLASITDAPVSPPLRSIDDGKERLRSALTGRQCLIVVDDVWHRWQSRAFDVVHAGAPSRILFTSRFPEALPEHAVTTDVERLSNSDSLAFIRSSAGSVPEGKALAAILDAAGGLRLALGVLSATARQDGWAAVDERLVGLEQRYGAAGQGDRASNAHKALHVAADSLADDDREWFWSLAAFPPDVRIPLSVLARLWSTTLAEAERWAARLIELDMAGVAEAGGAALAVGSAGLDLHDHVHDFVVLSTPRTVADRHLQLWELARQLGGPHLHALADVEPYLWDRAVWHAVRAGLNRTALRDLVTDVEWLAERVGRDGTQAAADDLRDVVMQIAAPDGPLDRLARVLRHGGLFEGLTRSADRIASLNCWSSGLATGGASVPRAPAVLRGWMPVPSQALLRTLRGHTRGVLGVAFGHDGTVVATASADGTARIWDPATGATIRTFAAHAHQVWGVAFDRDGTRLATSSLDGTARIWDTATGIALHTLTGHTGSVLGAAFNRDGTRLATSGTDLTARIWDTATGAMVATLAGHAGEASAVAFDHDGSRIATTGEDGTARIWDAKSGSVVAILRGHTGSTVGVAFNQDGTRLATTSLDGTARIWDTSDGATVAILTGHTSRVWAVAFNHDGTSLATTSADGTARIWDAATGAPVAVLRGHTSRVLGIGFNHDGTRLATSSADGTARIWDPTTGRVGALRDADQVGHSSRILGAAFNRSGTRLATTSTDRTARVWDLTSDGWGYPPQTILRGHDGEVWGVAFNDDGTCLATSSTDGTARIWNPGTGSVMTTLTGHVEQVWAVAFRFDGAHVASAGADQTLRIWNPVTGHTMTLSSHHGDVLGVAFSPDGNQLATINRDGTACIWDYSSGTTLHTLTGHGSESIGLAFDDGGTRLVTTSSDGTARVWDTINGTALVTLTGHTSEVLSAAFNHDGTRLATASTDGTVRIWHPTTGDEFACLALATTGRMSVAGRNFALSAGDDWFVVRIDDPELW